MEFRIRLAALEDLEPLGLLWEAMVEEARRLDPDMEIAENSAEYFCQFAGVGILSGSCGLFMAETEEDPVGFVLGQEVKPEPPFNPGSYGYILALYIRPDHRRSGLGRALLSSLTQWFAGRGIARMELHVYAGNQDAVRFWERAGFIVRGYRMGCPVSPVVHTHRK